jgi:ABC-type phosphate transport system substrate-binding protein
MVLPFSIVVQNNVRRLDSAGTDLGPIQNLTQTEIEQIFTRSARDWRELGYGVTTAANPPATPGQALSATAAGNTIRLCMREFGSGSKATFDQVLMKEEANEWNALTSNVAFYYASSSGVRDCLNDVNGTGFYGKIGYIDSFEATGSPAYITPAVANPMVYAHVVNINGYRGVDATVTDVNKATARPKVLQALRCGKSEFWVNLEGYTKTAGTGDTTRDAFINRFISDAANTTVIENIPANWAFEATPNLLATKTEDRIAPNHDNYASRSTEYDSQCRGFVASPAP